MLSTRQQGAGSEEDDTHTCTDTLNMDFLGLGSMVLSVE